MAEIFVLYLAEYKNQNSKNLLNFEPPLQNTK